MPLRVLHLIGSLGYGGVDHWLMNLLRLRRHEILIDFVVTSPGTLDAEARSLGANVHRIRPADPFPWNNNDLRGILLKHQYDAVHVHTAEYACYALKTGAECGISVRIAHAHSSGRPHPYSPKGVVRAAYHHTFNLSYCRKYATAILACSRDAGQFFFGRLWEKRRPEQMVYCGIPSAPYDVEFDRTKRLNLCRQYGLREDALVIGHFGRLSYPKNQFFLISVFAELARRNDRYILFVGGEGRLRKDLEEYVRKLNLDHRVVLPGSYQNGPELACQLFDVFFLPSIYEGLPIVLMEAVAGGLHGICSDVITREICDVVPECFSVLSLNDPIVRWADALEEGINRKRLPQEGAATLRKTPFTIEQSMDSLLRVYRQGRGNLG